VAGSLILASRSPQRRAILEQLGLSFEVIVPEVEELEQGPAEEVALENARRKAQEVAAGFPRQLVLGVDTVVSLDGELYGKPADPDDARRTLAALSGRAHTVTSGVCLVQGGEVRTATASTAVTFRRLGPALIDWYVASQEWRERAGGYAIQGRGAALVASIDGDYTNVVGLPVVALLELEPGLLAACGRTMAP
jgi:septum formation protein